MSEAIIQIPDAPSIELPEMIDGWQYSCQWHPDWADLPYTITGAPEQTMRLAGCVPTLQDVILRNLCGADTTPPELAEWNIVNGMRTTANGTLRASWNLLAQQTSLQQELIKKDPESIEAALSLGGIVIASVKTPHREGLGTPSGHVVGIHSLDSTGLKAIDVNNPIKTQRSWDIEEVVPFINSSLRHIRAGDGMRPPRLHKASAAQRLRARMYYAS